MFEGFDRRTIATPDADIHAVIGGSGPPLLLLHGYPQTHVMWHRIAPRLAEKFTVVASDLRGYGRSSKPAGDPEHRRYAKRTMAADQVAMMASLGFRRFRLAGHDRGARCAHRLVLDHPACIERAAFLDIVPTYDTWLASRRDHAYASFHWYFLAQPADLPERLIGADPDLWLTAMLKSWSADFGAFAPEALDAYRLAFRDPATIHATCEDYRAGFTADFADDREDAEAGRRIECPALVLWAERAGSARRLAVLDVWRQRAADIRGEGIASGHFLAEEAPEETARRLLGFFAS